MIWIQFQRALDVALYLLDGQGGGHRALELSSIPQVCRIEVMGICILFLEVNGLTRKSCPFVVCGSALGDIKGDIIPETHINICQAKEECGIGRPLMFLSKQRL